MTTKLFTMCMIRTAFVAALLLPVLADAANAATGGQEEKDLTPREQEEARVAQLLREAQQKKLKPKEFTRKLFGPAVLGNQRDAQRNAAAAEQFAEMSKEAVRSRDEKAAEKYRMVAELFQDSSKQNVRFVNAFKSVQSAVMRDALIRLYKNDVAIERVTGKRPKREWYFIPEMIATPADATGQPAAARPKAQ